MKIPVNYQGKKIAVLGAGESGEAAARLLAEEGAVVTILDSADPEKLGAKAAKLAGTGISLVAGSAADNDPGRYDLGILSPGIDPSAPLVRHFLANHPGLLTGELELSYGFCKCPVIAITGTNGKTTTTQLVERMLNACGVRTAAAGNIGPAFAARVRESAGLDVMTLEVSSFQLETLGRFRPRIAAWLNLTPDHLDRYPGMKEYRDAKLRIFENQTPEDFAVVNLCDDLPPLLARKITFSAIRPGGDFELRDGVIYHHDRAVFPVAETRLRGLHNAENLMAALGIGLAQGLAFEAMIPPLCSYTPLPHRCEPVRTVDGAEYINDSKATNLDALEKALASESRPVVLIAGGKDKGFEFESITDLVAEKARCAVLIGEMAERIRGCWGAKVRCEKAGSLAEAVATARRNARPGDAVLFSPGTSSFDMFINYADRGNRFKALVNQL